MSNTGRKLNPICTALEKILAKCLSYDYEYAKLVDRLEKHRSDCYRQEPELLFMTAV